MKMNEISTVDEEWYNPLTWFKKKPKSTTKVEPNVEPMNMVKAIKKEPKVKTVSPDVMPGDGLANQAANHLANNKNKKKKALDAFKKELGEEARPSRSITFKADDGMVELYLWNGVQAKLEDQTTSPESLVKTLVDLNIPKDIQIYNTDSIDLASHHGFDSDDDAHNIINKALKLWSSVKEDSGQDIESDIYAQDTWKNDWRKSEEMLNKYFDGNEDYLEAIMDNVTSDDYVNQTGDDYFWNKHAKIISDNFYGDWNWLEAIQYWDVKDIDKARSIYSNDFQKTHDLKPGNSNFDDRRRTTEAESVDSPDTKQKRIAIDTVKNPNKALLGGPSASEAEDILKTKFGYSDNQIAKLKGIDENIKRLKELSGINEDGVIVPGVNTTVDVQPGQTEKEAAKFGNGKIKPLMPKARKNSNPHKLFNLGLAEGDMEADKKNPHAQPYLDTQEWKDLHFMGDEIISAYIKHKQKGRLVGQAIGRAIANEGDIEADKRNPIAIPHLDNPWWKKLHDMDDKIISAYVKHKSLKRAVGRGIKKGLKKLSKIGSKHTSSSFDDQGNTTTNTTYGMANYKESEEGFVTLRKGDKEVKVHPDRVSHFIDRHYEIVKESKPRLLYTLLSEGRVFKVGNIKWDTESATGEGPEGLDLPSSVTVNVPGNHLGSYEDTEEFISNFITNYTGFTHKGFDTNPEIMEADKDGDGREDLKGFDAKTQYALKALQAKYPHADNLMSALMAQTEKTLEMQRASDKQQDEQDNKHNHRFQELEKKLINVIKKNKLTEDIKDREQIIKDYIKVFK